MLQVTRVFSNFPQLKQVNKKKRIRANIVIFLNCDLLDLEIQNRYKKPFYDCVFFRFV